MMITSYAAAPVGVPDEAVLFAFDDHSIPLQDNLVLTMQRAQKHPANPVLTNGSAGAPDERSAMFYGTVLAQEDTLRLWYMAMYHDQTGKRRLGSMAYAESEDGVHWSKPNLGLVEWSGNRDNNLCLIEPDPHGDLLGVLDYIAILYEPADPDPQRRYKLCTQRPVPASRLRGVGADPRESVYTMLTATSADGLRWRIVDPEGLPIAQAFQACGLYKFGGTYFSAGQQLPPWAWLRDGRPCGRVMSVYQSSDFEQWSSARSLAFVRGGYVSTLSGEGEEVNSAAGIWNRGNVLVGLYGMWHGQAGSWPDPWAANRVDLGLVVSNDGLHFREPAPDFAVIPRGGTDEWDCKALLPAYAFVNRGERTYAWYGHWDSHRQGYMEAVGLATLRRDGFGHLARRHAGADAHFITCALQANGPCRLFVNAEGVTPDCPLRVELLDMQSRPLAGYAGEACVPLGDGGLRVPARWRTGEEIAGLGGQPFRVKVTLAGGLEAAQKVYALYLSAVGQND